ncbi:MAG: ComEC/Rec2 family competence protein [Alphaproteobacteria bacterium]|nr:ComEC/Rec2 family competence protein [Alphaproteobacteria bacterium]
MKKLLLKFFIGLKHNIAAEPDRLIAWVPFYFALGIALYFALPFEPNLWFSLGGFELCLVLFYVFRYKNFHSLFIAMLLILSGFLNIQAQTLYKTRHIENITDKTITYLRGTIQNISYSERGKMRLMLTDAADFDKQLKGNYRITVTPEPENVQIGQCVEMIATIFPRKPLAIRNGYRLDRKQFYESLSATGYSNSETFVIDCPPNTTRNRFTLALHSWRQQITSYIDSVLPPAQSGVVDAILLGEKSHLPHDIINNYRDSGLAHFLSVSGLHLSAVAGFIFYVVRFLLALFPAVALRWDIKKYAAIVAILFSAFYLLISGMAIPAQRAFIMTTVVLLGIIFNRQAISIRMVSFAALAVLIISPQALISISFQMSFAAVYALVAFYENHRHTTYCQHGFMATVGLYLGGIVLCDLVASLATAPFSLYHFHRLALYTSLGNLSAGPLIGLYLMPLVLLCLLTLPLHLALYPLKALGLGIKLLNHITDFVAHLPYSVWQTDALPLWALILIVCGGFWLCVWQKRWRFLGLLPIIGGIIPLFFAQSKPDMVFSANAADIAIRDNNDDLVMLPRQNDTWTKSLWTENLQLKILKQTEQENLRISDLKCENSGKCIYKNIITFDNTGNIWLNGEKINTSAGGYIFLQEKAYWQPLWKPQQRAWER